MIRAFLLFHLLLLACLAKGQFIEFGGGIGAMHYTGDLNSVPRIGQSKLAGNGVYRFNLSEIVSFRITFTAGKITGDDSSPVDALGEQRQYAFDHTMMELSSAFEYHFLDYRADFRQKWAPYALLGFGFVRMTGTQPAFEDYNRVQVVLPMGAGVKYLLSKRLTLSAELGARKTFTDYIDGISDGDQTIKNYQFGNPNDKDWYFYSGISLTYVLYNIPCPFPYIPNRPMLMRIRPN